MRYLLLFFVGVLMSCQKETAAPQSSKLVGAWELVSYQPVSSEFPKGGSVMKRGKRLAENNYAYQFAGNGQLKSRENAGWCATPPVGFATFEGQWTQDEDKLIIHKKYWGGDQHFSLKIVFVNDNQIILGTL